MKSIFCMLVMASFSLACLAQTPQAMDKKNPLLCGPEEGFCELPGASPEEGIEQASSNAAKIRVSYFTDPICSSCWGIEPQLRKLKLAYGQNLEINYHMGGLLPDWSYNSGGISKPSDVAHHWDEVSGYYDMPIDGDLWLEDPLHSSYPPSIAFKAAQLQDEKKALVFLRELRELVFLEKKNITKWAYVVQAAEKAGLDVARLKTDVEGEGKRQFEEDLKLARQMGVRGFPTMFFVDESGNQELVYGSRPYEAYQAAMAKLDPSLEQQTYPQDWKALFAHYPSLTAKEFSTLSGVPRSQSEAVLDELVVEGVLAKYSTKNGSIWRVKPSQG